MTDTPAPAASAVGGAAKRSPLGELARSEAADRLRAEAQEYLAARAQQLLAGAGRRLGETTNRLNDIAEGNSPGLARLALDGGRKLAEGKGPLRSALELGASRAKDRVVGAVRNAVGGRGGGRGGSGNRPTVIIEYADVGVPLRTAYDQWTRYQDFSTFAKGVKSARRADGTTSDWQMKVFWSNRSWKARTTEQVPDDRISWTSEGAKGTTQGVVSFHPLADRLTRVILVIEYYPKGLFEKTGNLWRAQGRRARLDLKNYVRHITLKGEAEDGWRGEIRDGEVVRDHEEVVAEEEREQGPDEAEGDGPGDGEPEAGHEETAPGDGDDGDDGDDGYDGDGPLGEDDGAEEEEEENGEPAAEAVDGPDEPYDEAEDPGEPAPEDEYDEEDPEEEYIAPDEDGDEDGDVVDDEYEDDEYAEGGSRR
ncbi:SRPBCC family protein [Streptomyces sp. NPDC052077]|uniref:SRPBCC family protein n=1 Tax=Streptomyces sp. NPDC052077 TaxID=3154757 RepID=UPI00342C7087